MSRPLRTSTLFHTHHHLSSADHLSPPETLARIETTVLLLLRSLTSPSDPSLPSLPLTTRASSNAHLSRDLFTSLPSALFLSRRSVSSKTLNPSFIRIFKILLACQSLLQRGKLITQRELFYRLISTSPNYFSSQPQLNRSVQDAVALLRCTRQSLGIIPSSRGLIAGRIRLRLPNPNQPPQAQDQMECIDCCLCGSSGYAISGDLNVINGLAMESDARYIIVVEKHAVFHRLVEDKFYNRIPSILITARGYPDLATRVLLHRISRSYPSLPILGLVDWNPAGLAILCTFKYGSIGMGLEAYRYACDVKWLGLRGGDLGIVPEEAKVPLKGKDLQVAKGLMKGEMLEKGYREELELMVGSGRRVEIEALYCRGYEFLGKYIADKIVQRDYI